MMFSILSNYKSYIVIVLLTLFYSCDEDSSSPNSNNLSPVIYMENISNEINGEYLLEVEAFDNDGSIAFVEFYINQELVFSDDSEPYSYLWDTYNQINGDCFVYAIAYDNLGASNLSVPQITTINNSPTILIELSHIEISDIDPELYNYTFDISLKNIEDLFSISMEIMYDKSIFAYDAVAVQGDIFDNFNLDSTYFYSLDEGGVLSIINSIIEGSNQSNSFSGSAIVSSFLLSSAHHQIPTSILISDLRAINYNGEEILGIINIPLNFILE